MIFIISIYKYIGIYCACCACANIDLWEQVARNRVIAAAATLRRKHVHCQPFRWCAYICVCVFVCLCCVLCVVPDPLGRLIRRRLVHASNFISAFVCLFVHNCGCVGMSVVCVCVYVACIVGAIPLGRMITLYHLDVLFNVCGSRSGSNTVNSLKFKTESQQSLDK